MTGKPHTPRAAPGSPGAPSLVLGAELAGAVLWTPPALLRAPQEQRWAPNPGPGGRAGHEAELCALPPRCWPFKGHPPAGAGAGPSGKGGVAYGKEGGAKGRGIAGSPLPLRAPWFPSAHFRPRPGSAGGWRRQAADGGGRRRLRGAEVRAGSCGPGPASAPRAGLRGAPSSPPLPGSCSRARLGPGHRSLGTPRRPVRGFGPRRAGGRPPPAPVRAAPGGCCGTAVTAWP